MTARRTGVTRASTMCWVAPVLALLVIVAASCTGGGHESARSDTPDSPPPRPDRVALEASGGAATVHNTGSNAFAQSAPGLTSEERRAFVVGNNFFNDNWVTAPASTTARDGLGPVFNAQSCSSCHFKDGRGEPPTEQDPNANGLLLRLSVPGSDAHGGPNPHAAYGDQLQDTAINGVPAEGRIEITEREITGTYDDGTPYTLLDPSYEIAEPAFGPLGDDVMVSPRIAPPVFGTGLLEAIDAEDIEAIAATQTEDDGPISGRTNRVWSPVEQQMVLGRFGWKANVATVEEQTAAAFLGDIGITSRIHREQNCTPAQSACLAAPAGGTPDEPELTDSKLDRVVFYTRALAVPARRDVGDPVTDRGEQLFEELSCSTCHVPELRTGDTDIEPLSDQTIRPYTDLLLHDMGDGLADGRSDFDATGTEWRTPPLWGIGLTEAVNRHSRFLHDGRARDLTEAVLWHGGEAEQSQQGFLALDRSDRDALIAFLNSL